MVQILCGVNFGTKRKRRISRRSGISPFDTILGGVWISCLSQSFGPWLKGGGGVKTQMARSFMQPIGGGGGKNSNGTNLHKCVCGTKRNGWVSIFI